MAITDIDNTQVYSVSVGTSGTGYRSPAGGRFAYVRTTEADVVYQVADESANVAVQDLTGTNMKAPAAEVAATPCAGPITAGSWHLIQLSDADAPSIGDKKRRAVLYLQAGVAIAADQEKCFLRFTRTPL